ncbi:MAG: hypothetical protein LWW93_12205 [Hyphomicrobiales bacterium]|nr:hypothetical protein [Hyphomicrobiales bacterium]
MFQKSILVIGAFAAIGASFLTTPARADGGGLFAAMGLFEREAAGGMRSLPAGASVRYVGAPAWQRGRNGWVQGYPGTRVAVSDLGYPYAGPNRHTACGWQDRYDRHERYIGSQRICWVEAR